MNNQDIFDQADNAVETKPTYETWGQCFSEFYEAVWQKGQSAPERFDAQIHDAKDRFIRAEIAVVPLDEMNAKFNTEFKGNVTGWNNKDWAAVVLPSIKALGISARDIHSKFVKIAKKPNGKFYDKKKDGVKTGEKGELTDFLFVKVFASQDECLADYVATKSGEPASPLSNADFPALDPAPAPVAAPVTSGVKIETLMALAKSIITRAVEIKGKDLAAVTDHVAAQISTNNFFKGRFTHESPEIKAMIIEACQ